MRLPQSIPSVCALSSRGSPRGPEHPPPGLLFALNPSPWRPTTAPDQRMQARPAVTVTSILHGESGSSHPALPAFSPFSLPIVPTAGIRQVAPASFCGHGIFQRFGALIHKLGRTKVTRSSAPSTPRVPLPTSPAPRAPVGLLGTQPRPGSVLICI